MNGLIHDDDDDDGVLKAQLLVMCVHCQCTAVSDLYKCHFYNMILPYLVIIEVDIFYVIASLYCFSRFTVLKGAIVLFCHRTEIQHYQQT